MYKKGDIGVGIGSTSIIMVFVVLCLTTFGALALVTVDGDYKLTKKTGESITHFYEADGKAEEMLAQIDEVLIKSGQEVGEVSRPVDNKEEKRVANKEENRISKAGKPIEDPVDKEGLYKTYITKELGQLTDFEVVSNENQQLEVSYQVPVDERQSLGIKVQINSYAMSQESRYTLLEWTLRSVEDWEYEEIEFEDIIIGQ